MPENNPLISQSPDILALRARIRELESEIVRDPLVDFDPSMYADPSTAVMVVLQKKSRRDSLRREAILRLRGELNALVETLSWRQELDIGAMLG